MLLIILAVAVGGLAYSSLWWLVVNSPPPSSHAVRRLAALFILPGTALIEGFAALTDPATWSSTSTLLRVALAKPF